MFTRAITCAPAFNFANGLTSASLGVPTYERALNQHQAYCSALQSCGLALIRLRANERYPDSTFVEDTAVLTEHFAVLTRPGAAPRRGEVESVKELLLGFYQQFYSIEEPGTLDGGDVCQAGNHFFIGLSERTNEAGVRQLARFVAEFGYTSSVVDIRSTRGLLHLKSGLTYIGDNRLVAIETLSGRDEFAGYSLVPVSSADDYAANCVRINDRILVAAGFPVLEQQLLTLGYETIALEMSEFQKMDGGLSCLSLRF